eukprot:TRINITY_DN10876_c0_g1_i1.p1 TRINITY_DN10876_c0_g1~~TRINITY_DN10876_c0_g1_i1.p1  ORF type:complete len:477 (+),score=63.48 TRINITY_DN10876_c0_g1_i1:128-1432(+)
MAGKKFARELRRAVKALCAVKGKCSKSSRPTSIRKTTAIRRSVVGGGVHGLRVLETEVVSFRVGSARIYARVPAVVKELLRLRAQCDGIDAPAGRVARLAVEVMERYSYDPINTVRALSSTMLLSPVRLQRVLGSGCNGTVFLEDTGDVVKVTLDEDAPDEFRHLTAFHAVGLAPRPIALLGPRLKFGGSLYNLRMEAVDTTLGEVLRSDWRSGGAISSSSSLEAEKEAQVLGTSLAGVLARMASAGLVHGDLHLGNVGLKGRGDQRQLLLLDFGRSANAAQRGGVEACADALRAGHEYDVFNVIVELCSSFGELLPELNAETADLEGRLRRLVRPSDTARANCTLQVQRLEQIGSLQKRLAEQQGLGARAEALHDAVLAAFLEYASFSCDWSFAGPPSVRNTVMRQSAEKRMQRAYSLYFQSYLYWGDWQYKA